MMLVEGRVMHVSYMYASGFFSVPLPTTGLMVYLFALLSTDTV